MYLIDTNVLSEAIKPTPNEGAIAFLGTADDAAISVLTLFEIRFGLLDLPSEATTKRRKIEQLLLQLRTLFSDRVLPVDERVALKAAEIRSRTKTFNPGMTDLLIAATGAVHDLTIVTRNERHFEPLGVHVLNPFS